MAAGEERVRQADEHSSSNPHPHPYPYPHPTLTRTLTRLRLLGQRAPANGAHSAARDKAAALPAGADGSAIAGSLFAPTNQ